MFDGLGTLLYLPPRHPTGAAEDVFLRYPGGRLRIHPNAIPLLSAWLSAAGSEWRGLLAQSVRGKTPTERRRIHGEKEYARTCLACVNKLVGRMTGTVSTEEVETFLRTFFADLTEHGADAGGPVRTRWQQGKLPLEE
jgi:hypothetical protein